MAIGLGTAILGATVLGTAGSIYGSSLQSDAIEKAAESTENWQNYLVAFEERKYDEAAKFRDLAYQEASQTLAMQTRQMSLVEQDIADLPQSAREYYSLAATRGTEDIISNLAPYGLSPASSTAGKAVGLMQEGLSAQEAKDLISQKQFQIQSRLGLLGKSTGATAETGYSANLAGGTQAQGLLSDLYTTEGAVTGGLYGSIGQTITQLPLYYQLYNMLGKTGTTTT